MATGLIIGLAGILTATSAAPAKAVTIIPDPCLAPDSISVDSDVTIPDGCTQGAPILPSTTSASGQFIFPTITPRRWYDPPFVSRYDYSLSTGNFLSFILPSGFGNTIDLYLGDTLKASNLLGDGTTEYFFSALTPSTTVTSFNLRDITPLRDAADPNAFPVFLDFTTSSSGLTITPTSAVSAPGPLPALGVSTAFAFSRRLRRRINASAR